MDEVRGELPIDWDREDADRTGPHDLVTDADGALGASAPAPTVCRGHGCGQ
jgi:hypothetical protein